MSLPSNNQLLIFFQFSITELDFEVTLAQIPYNSFNYLNKYYHFWGDGVGVFGGVKINNHSLNMHFKLFLAFLANIVFLPLASFGQVGEEVGQGFVCPSW